MSKKWYFSITALLAIIILSASTNLNQFILTKYFNSINDPKLCQVITDIVAKHNNKDLVECLIVRLANSHPTKITMYGKQINDTFSCVEGRKKYDIHPYGKVGIGVSVVPAYKDKAGSLYILFGKKSKEDKLILLGGYMKPHPLEGSEIDPEEGLSDEDKDKAEEALLEGKEGYKKIAPLGEAKKTTYDYSLEDTARRELAEEGNLKCSSNEGCKLQFLSTRSEFGVTNDPRLHTVVSDYLFNYGTRDVAPKATPGSDIAEIYWVKAANIIKDKNLKPQKYGSKTSRYMVNINGHRFLIRDDHGDVIETAMNRMRR